MEHQLDIVVRELKSKGLELEGSCGSAPSLINVVESQVFQSKFARDAFLPLEQSLIDCFDLANDFSKSGPTPQIDVSSDCRGDAVEAELVSLIRCYRDRAKGLAFIDLDGIKAGTSH